MTAIAPPAPALPRLGMLSRLGDEALANRAAAGSTAAFTALYERYHGPLLGYCRSILLNDEDAHDATQNALENALRSLPRREPGRPLKPWLYRIAHNEAINIVRRRRPHAELTELDEPSVPGPEVDSEHRVRLAQLVDDLRGLPERQRGALVMRELSGLSYDDIALALGVSNEAARRAVFDARSALHEAVDGRATECVSVRHCISDGDRRRLRGRSIRAHLRSCDDCASFQRAIGARSADLHLLGPWLSGAAIANFIGGGALIAAGGGAATATVAGWSSMPVFLKGVTVAAVVATAGGAAAEIKHVTKPDSPAAQAQAARKAAAASSPTAPALKPAAMRTAVSRPRRASVTSSRGGLRSDSSAPKAIAERAEKVATPVTAAPVAVAPAPAAPATAAAGSEGERRDAEGAREDGDHAADGHPPAGHERHPAGPGDRRRRHRGRAAGGQRPPRQHARLPAADDRPRPGDGRALAARDDERARADHDLRPDELAADHDSAAGPVGPRRRGLDAVEALRPHLRLSANAPTTNFSASTPSQQATDRVVGTDNTRKGKPVARRGRKTRGLTQAAQLPKGA